VNKVTAAAGDTGCNGWPNVAAEETRVGGFCLSFKLGNDLDRLAGPHTLRQTSRPTHLDRLAGPHT